jgi:hypothetical protein
VKSKVLRIGIFFAIAIWAGHWMSAQSGTRFKARISPVPVDATTKMTITGLGSAAGVLTDGRLIVTGTFEGLHSPATIAQIHRGQVMGVRGPVIGDLTVSQAASGTISGSLELTPAQVEDLKSGRMYIQIHSENAPQGNLWGWFVP